MQAAASFFFEFPQGIDIERLAQMLFVTLSVCLREGGAGAAFLFRLRATTTAAWSSRASEGLSPQSTKSEFAAVSTNRISDFARATSDSTGNRDITSLSRLKPSVVMVGSAPYAARNALSCFAFMFHPFL